MRSLFHSGYCDYWRSVRIIHLPAARPTKFHILRKINTSEIKENPTDQIITRAHLQKRFLPSSVLMRRDLELDVVRNMTIQADVPYWVDVAL